MSALVPEADIRRRIEHVRYVPGADTCQLCKWPTPTAIIGRIGWPRAVPAASVSQEIMLDVRDRRPHPGAK